MQEYDPSTYGDRIADIYDDFYPTRIRQDDRATDALAELADGGRVLELGIGTGRMALPLAARGLEVHGIEASVRMLEKLRAKPGGADLQVTIGDFADVGAEGRFDLVFIAFNTLFALTTEADQARCFRNVAEHLADGGAFVVEAFVPDLGRFDRDQTVRAVDVDDDQVLLEASIHDPREQVIRSQHIWIRNGSLSLFPVKIRYAWPDELDRMSRDARMRLRGRWGGWRREPFTADSGKHVSVYERV